MLFLCVHIQRIDILLDSPLWEEWHTHLWRACTLLHISLWNLLAVVKNFRKIPRTRIVQCNLRALNSSPLMHLERNWFCLQNASSRFLLAKVAPFPQQMHENACSRDTDFAPRCERFFYISSQLYTLCAWGARHLCTCTLLIINFSASITFRRISMPFLRVERARRISRSRLRRLEFGSAALADARFLCKLYCPLRWWSLCTLWMPETWCARSLGLVEWRGFSTRLLMKRDFIAHFERDCWRELLFKLFSEIIIAAWNRNCIVERQFLALCISLSACGLISIHFPLTRNFDPILWLTWFEKQLILTCSPYGQNRCA